MGLCVAEQIRPFVFMGGTFDPVHNGHLRTALEIKQWLGVDQVCLIPSKMPVHRAEPGCTSLQRFEMVEASVQGEPALTTDSREVLSDQPSYSLLTLQSLRNELGADAPLVMILGMDAFLMLHTWYQWQQIPQLCHILVVSRPGYSFTPGPEIETLLDRYGVDDVSALKKSPAGAIFIHELTPLGISATQIRKLIRNGLSPRYLLPETVWRYIREHQLYGYVPGNEQ